ncbi:MAG: cytochrome c3 family protein [Deltaproteobacteria bacterium]|nr:cytochrome c3 family protein [Deltaproteobacteria bacterium]
MKTAPIKSLAIPFLCIILAGLLILKEESIPRPQEPVSEGCLFCHKTVKDPDPSHPVSALGCHGCHMGNPHAFNKDRAHVRMVSNPGDLRVAETTCGKPECHPDIVPRVKKSVMATNKGIINTLKHQWMKNSPANQSVWNRATKTQAIGVRALYLKDASEDLVLDHYRKMCGGCHLWKERGDREGEVGRRGGGCSDCHILDQNRSVKEEKDPSDHPKMTTRIPSENCVKCHNRSARIGLSYFGRFESAGYGTPYRGRSLSNRRLSGNRFFLNLQADIHHQKAQMDCIDCHTATGVMGDGKDHEQMETQTDITCQACHQPRFAAPNKDDALAGRLIFLNKRTPDIDKKEIAFSKKGTPLYNLQNDAGKSTFYRKRDGKPFHMNISSFDKPHHALKGHERLSCQACHSAWIPQCYGCHLTYRKSQDQKDWISRKPSSGRWKETRSYIRFSTPALGIRQDSGVFPLSPCQVFVSYFDASDAFRSEMSFNTVNVSAFDPHTTSTASRPCIECHGDTKTLGLGQGLLFEQDNDVQFRPTYDAQAGRIALPFALDAFVNIRGEPLQQGAWGHVRPFDRTEMERILYVGLCAGCHKRYDDPVYEDFLVSKQRFETEAELPCLK